MNLAERAARVAGPSLPDALRHNGLLPDGAVAVAVGGSVARGWQSDSSDIDAYVVTRARWTSDTAVSLPGSLAEPAISMEWVRLEGIPVDVQYWTEAQVSELLARFSRDRPAAGAPDAAGAVAGSPVAGLSKKENSLLERLPTMRAGMGEPWLRAAQERHRAGTFTSGLIHHFFDFCDERLEDAWGQARAGDWPSAVVSTGLAFGFAVDGLLAAHGEAGSNPKWRPRRMRSCRPPHLTWEQYWAVETMRDYDDDDPAAWVELVMRRTRRLTAEVDAG